MVSHIITVTSRQLFPLSWIHVATCSCEEYKSRHHVFLGDAERAGFHHVATRLKHTFSPATFYRQMRRVEERVYLEAQ